MNKTIIYLKFFILSGLLFMSAAQPIPKIAGFWRYCETSDCKNAEGSETVVGFIFDDSICHAFIGLPDGLEPEILMSCPYQLANDSLITFQKNKVFKSAFRFLNDSIFELRNDSNDISFYHRMQ